MPIIWANKHFIKVSANPFYADDIQLYILFDPYNGLLCVTTHVVVFMVSVLHTKKEANKWFNTFCLQ